ncbi:MFS transporter [Microbacterium murale]|uniref:MHS family shikimate/dehydroshikimate transporter-like MFS transporter n=1 Tax=Microbacterium murale TaxID=1081040 RepID=A0ABU0P5B4_9MICO|nr:MFS transporter [Microbacterium murale]MDQ0642510.1 MHS family shikimate/dehydroshikimate transporter-like MFS transporter [Microbacterium murale]
MNSTSATVKSQQRNTILASVLGSVIEWYDFFLYATMAALVFNSEFFPEFDPLIGTLVAFGTFAAGFITRPIGGLIFGHFGDRIGRKKILVITMLIMGISTFLMGCLPTYAQIGVAAPVLLLLLRMLQGIGLGGEWGGAAILTFEHAPRGKRGMFSAWPQTGVPLGLLLSTLAVNLVSIPGDEALIGWTWRIPFLASIVLVVVGLVVRLQVSEPQAFKDMVKTGDRVKVPVFEVLRHYPKQVLVGIGARFSESITFNVYNAFILTYTTTVLGLPNSYALNGLLIASVIGFIVIPLAGRLSDAHGRRPVFAAGAAIAFVTAFPVFWLIDSGVVTLIWLAIIVGWALGACTMFGAEAAFFAELFPARVRYTGMSLVYQLGVLPSGAVAPVIAIWLVSISGSSWPVAVYIMVAAAIALVSLYFAKETAHDDIDVELHAKAAEQAAPISADTAR